ncbi:hypothetical protein [Fusobacterium sp. PH5-44]|uniref:hypothetical protein n=1 Tax=unclassified Fusobacterium TaxID=2648384 RepID=UPI003D1DCA11
MLKDAGKAKSNSNSTGQYLQSAMGAMNSFSSLMSSMNSFSSSLSFTMSSNKSKYTSENNYSVGSNVLVGDNVVLNGENPNNLMAVNDSDGRLAINLAGIGFGNVDNLLTGVVHEGGHGTYANAAIDEKAVGALTGKIVYDQNKGIILSYDLARKVQGDTVQYFNDRADGKLNDLAIGKNFSMAFTPIIRTNGGQTSYIVIDTQNGKGYEVAYKEMGIGVGIDIGFSWNSVILPEINHPSELSGNSRSIGANIFYWGYEYQKEGNNTISGGKYVGHKNGVGMGKNSCNNILIPKIKNLYAGKAVINSNGTV